MSSEMTLEEMKHCIGNIWEVLCDINDKLETQNQIQIAIALDDKETLKKLQNIVIL